VVVLPRHFGTPRTERARRCALLPTLGPLRRPVHGHARAPQHPSCSAP
jgi:hypothetical protein